MGALWQDVRFGLRMLAMSPGFTTVAVLTLALGIGANAAIFSILDPLLLRKLPVQNPDELVLVHAAGTMHGEDSSELSSYFIYRDNAAVFSGVLAASIINGLPVTKDGETTPVQSESVSGDFFEVLGLRPFRGRLLIPTDSKPPHGEQVVVLSFDYWRRDFHADEGVLGKTLTIKNVPYTIVGVTPPDFFGITMDAVPQFYVPIGAYPNREWWIAILARLKPGVSMAQAQAGLEPLFRQAMTASTVPEIEKQQDMSRLVLTPAARGLSDLRAQFSLSAKILMVVVGLVLLIACSNVANLLFARGAARRKEITVRLALGAGRWRLVRQLLTESALLGAMGAALGLLVAGWVGQFLIASLSTERNPIHLVAGTSGRVLLFTTGVLIVTVLLCGLVPALAATRGDLAQYLKVQSSGLGGAPSRRWLAKLPVVVQVALSVTVLAGAGLLLHSLYNLETLDVGFDRANVITVTFNSNGGGRTPEEVHNFYDALAERARNLPGVRSACVSATSPIDGLEYGINVEVEGHPLNVGESHVFFTNTMPGYFETLGIPLLAGRDFSAHDNADSPHVAIINQTMARHYFGSQNPIGKHFKFVEGTRPPMEIIGVAADSIYFTLRESHPDYLYLDRAQSDSRGSVAGTLDIRANGNARALAAPVREMMRSLDSTVQVRAIRTLRDQVEESLHSDKVIAGLCGIFSLLALVLTCVGLYGMLSFSVVRRTNEIGVRMALGAEPRDIFRLVVGGGMRLTLAGLLLGALGAIASGSLLASLLFGVERADPITFAGVAILLVAAAILACYIPARRAMRTDPLVALRYE
jgi:predicted permease